MAGQHLANQKKYRIEELALEGKFDRAERIVNSDNYSPIFQNQYYHPEAEPNSESLNDDLSDILNDLWILDGEFAVLSEGYKNLLEESIQKIDYSKRGVVAAREKIMDLNMICAEDSGFFQVTTLTNDHFKEDVINEDNVITAKPTGLIRTSLNVLDVIGNGLEGNEYVFADGKFISEDTFTGNRKYITDGSLATIYEYQKINASKSEPYVFTDLSFDGAEAYCTITIQADKLVSSIKISSPDNEIILREVQVSSDNDEYISMFSGAMKFNKKEEMYQDSQYIYESGIVAFPLSRFIKLSFSSNGYTGDRIAFKHDYLE